MVTGTGRRDHNLAASRKPREQTSVGHSYELSEPSPSNILPPVKLYLLNLLKQYHLLRTPCENT